MLRLDLCAFFSKKYSSFFFSLDFVLSVRLHCHSNKHCVRSQNTTYTKIARLNKIRRLYVYLSIFPSLVVCCATPWLVLKLKFYLLLYKIQIFISFLIVDVFFLYYYCFSLFSISFGCCRTGDSGGGGGCASVLSSSLRFFGAQLFWVLLLFFFCTYIVLMCVYACKIHIHMLMSRTRNDTLQSLIHKRECRCSCRSIV